MFGVRFTLCHYNFAENASQMKDGSNVSATLWLPSSAIGYSVCCINISMYCLVLVCGLPMQKHINHVAFIIYIIPRNSQELYRSAYKL